MTDKVPDNITEALEPAEAEQQLQIPDELPRAFPRELLVPWPRMPRPADGGANRPEHRGFEIFRLEFTGGQAVYPAIAAAGGAE